MTFLHWRQSSPVISNCKITGNSGGISLSHGAPVITNCEITNNQWGNYGGISCVSSRAKITNCIIQSNISPEGGGIAFSNSVPTITNCLIAWNSCDLKGAGILCIKSFPIITHCTIMHNDAWGWGGHGGGWAGGIGVTRNSRPVITNSIIWQNTADSAADIGVDSSSQVDITYSDIFGGWPGEGNINQPPQFDGYHLTLESPCINAGRPVKVFTDIDGQRRPFGAGWDMGADEYSTEEPLPCSMLASSGNQFMALYMIPVLALIFLRRRFLRR